MPITNSQFGFALFNFSASPHGCSTQFTVATGLETIAGTSTGKWCTAGNVLGFDSNSNFIECSLTYFASGGSKTKGWYFWYGYNGGAGTYQSLGTYDPTGDTVTLYIQIAANGHWSASFLDTNYNSSKQTYDTGIASTTLSEADIWFENGGDLSCCDYKTFGGTQFTHVTFYDGSNNAITNNWSAIVHPNPNPPGNCTTPSTSNCIFADTISLNVYYNCTVC